MQSTLSYEEVRDTLRGPGELCKAWMDLLVKVPYPFLEEPPLLQGQGGYYSETAEGRIHEMKLGKTCLWILRYDMIHNNLVNIVLQ